MTPGMEALFEAMRIEQARIYSQLSPEITAPKVNVAPPVSTVDDEQLILAWTARGRSTASIALRTGLSKQAVQWVLDQPERRHA